MRRAQSVRHYARPSLALGADDLGMLKESPEESNEDVLRRQLLEKDRENDKVASFPGLAQGPPMSALICHSSTPAADSNTGVTSTASTTATSGENSSIRERVHKFGNSASGYPKGE
ncbi:hypothetical protein AcV7_001460 [Taiwanofungus camphoratus]|nr:hypothetical protein AcV7_001460 [Antrodia cinnamomea]